MVGRNGGKPDARIMLAACLLSVLFRKVNGERANEGEFPFLVSIATIKRATGQRVQLCAGSLYTADRLFTSCHCLVSGPPPSDATKFNPFKPPQSLRQANSLYVMAGSVDIEKATGIYGKKLKVHPQCYADHTTVYVDYDYGVLEITTPFTLSPGRIELQPISPDRQQVINELLKNLDGLPCRLVGWGAETDSRYCQKFDIEINRDYFERWSHPWKTTLVTLAKDRKPPQVTSYVDSAAMLVCSNIRKTVVGTLTTKESRPILSKTPLTPNIFMQTHLGMEWMRIAFNPEPTTTTTSTASPGSQSTPPDGSSTTPHGGSSSIPTTEKPNSLSPYLLAIYLSTLCLFLLCICVLLYTYIRHRRNSEED